jgi:hypothetical protein
MPDELHSVPQVDIDRDKIKRAVKEALDDKAIEDLGKQMTALSTQMTEGFSKITTRQDVANGKLMKHEYAIEEQNKEIAQLKQGEDAINRRTTFWQRNQDKMVWAIIGVGFMLLYFLLQHAGFPNFLAK